MLKQPKQLINPFMVAPMMGWTTRHYRYFMRLISQEVTLYTEMITTGALLNNSDHDRFLAFHASEQPLALQLGGSVAAELAQAAKIAQRYGYTEINLNVGCPSDRVQSGCFGAVLMKDIHHLAECIAAMKAAVPLSITVKTRIGVDDYESYEYLAELIQTVSAAGCKTFIIHARKAWLKGLSPKENREVPPLNYEWVYQIKRDFPELAIVINGGIKNLAEARDHLRYVDGVMIGRAAWHTPYMFRELERVEREDSVDDRIAIVQKYSDYAQAAFMRGESLSHLLQPLFGLFHGITGARQWRGQLTQAIQMNVAPAVVLREMLVNMADNKRLISPELSK
ncbi:tRNA-dihydrouridine synthase [Candidatus Rickettsiella viridis]|uniref:tRNA-dihydrouridine(20/20a) synthase n=1 Tax=Candidatus Rickettsiella viridis TaxID=676208 RepID=A0A2Z5UWP3_9COXI|nr:tRNA dihydrouridine(20/20a) synthase DusA [Candidatus Rickettsiella viridis]BBB15461.1 tRNA-dihydrouridine synthase [Candidatus Rickettsiella viridis]